LNIKGDVMERRRHQRFQTSIPIVVQAQASDFKTFPWINQGNVKNISYGGIYFTCHLISPFLRRDQIRQCIITSLLEKPNSPPLFSGRIRVVRLDRLESGSHDSGVAFEFIAGKFYGYHIK
jgi:hypothetical protein